MNTLLVHTVGNIKNYTGNNLTFSLDLTIGPKKLTRLFPGAQICFGHEANIALTYQWHGTVAA